MKVLKLTLFASLFLLLASSSASLAASNSMDFEVNYINDGAAASLDIYFVGESSLAQDEIAMSTYGTYDIVSSEPVLLTVKVNITGYTMWTDIFNYTGTPTEAFATAGQLDMVIDGSVSTVGAGYVSGSGGFVSLTGAYDHTVAFIYSLMAEDGTFSYATDSITVRIREAAADFGDFDVKDYALSYDVTDVAVAGENISRAHTVPVYGYQRNATVEINECEVTVEGSTMNEEISIVGQIDSTGSMDDATDEWVTSTIGRAFLFDAEGLHLIGDTAPTVAKVRYSGANDTSTYIGVVVLGDAGIGYHYYDHEGLRGTYGDTDNEVDFEFSFDFLSAMSGAWFIEGSETVIERTVDTPGFEAALSFVSLAIIAYVVPRKFKK
ncbi:MAG: hypothetical protein INQ03_25315 [Candidatus Heimdallarchaeota archaeon]|nr:hypothetical protein [Candidatus Heimdallarchaeota archaeon]